MINVRRAVDRGHADHGWLNTNHTFSFGAYYDPEQMGFRSLRVMNEDRVAPGKGFGTHGHKDMEIVSYVLQGELEHRDSMGNGEVLRPGEFQRITAGTGITHSEFNPSTTESTHFYQIWITPRTTRLAPGYEQKHFADQELQNRFRLVASPDGEDGSITIQQDAKISLARITRQQSLEALLAPGRHAWLQVLRGNVELNGVELSASDGAAVSNESTLSVTADSDAEVMLFDLA